MIVLTNKRYRLKEGADVEKYIPFYCGTYPDNKIIELLKTLSTKSLNKAYQHTRKKQHENSYYRNLTYHLFLRLEKENQMINGTLIYNFEDNSHLELAPDNSFKYF